MPTYPSLYAQGGWTKDAPAQSPCKDMAVTDTCCDFEEMHVPITATITF